ncbi:MAG: DUF3782 domain-containing protein [Desulfurococcaceae archaeon]|nr:DUF3782 domain-containing protein [Desulfurococcaceae archaeon]
MYSTDTYNPSKLKEEFLKLLEEDKEFRLAVAGLIGLDTIISELKKLREDFLTFVNIQEKRWEENNKRWEENNRRWEENNRRWEENEKRWIEAFKRFEAIEKTLLEHTKILQEHSKRLEELERTVVRIEINLNRLGGRWGRNMERTVLELFRKVLEERGIEPGRVEKFEYIDRDGKFYKKGARIEVDMYIHNEKLYLIEVKSLVEYGDVEYFHDKAQIVEKILGRRADKLMLIAVNIYDNALKRARELGIDVVYGAVIPFE